jgi:hypothetical protein
VSAQRHLVSAGEQAESAQGGDAGRHEDQRQDAVDAVRIRQQIPPADLDAMAELTPRNGNDRSEEDGRPWMRYPMRLRTKWADGRHDKMRSSRPCERPSYDQDAPAKGEGTVAVRVGDRGGDRQDSYQRDDPVTAIQGADGAPRAACGYGGDCERRRYHQAGDEQDGARCLRIGALG